MGTEFRIPVEQIRDYLAKGWLTHDGMWFYHVCTDVGMEKANTLNRAAIRSMAVLEVKRTRDILGFANRRIESFDEIYDYLQKALDLLLPGSVRARLQIRAAPPNVILWEWEEGECFAYKGIKLIGCIDRYACGVMYRIGCWLDALQIEHRIDPVIHGCMMHEQGYCRGEIIINCDR
ncbi:MAG: hypothetical protein A2176_03260 [Spirochaetes bacterium RBG_13_51_14]|nr:MAG: hypothetical protein A2176_03260 [Spirochaetes bacterium RBG_13_51_14]